MTRLLSPPLSPLANRPPQVPKEPSPQSPSPPTLPHTQPPHYPPHSTAPPTPRPSAPPGRFHTQNWKMSCTRRAHQPREAGVGSDGEIAPRAAASTPQSETTP